MPERDFLTPPVNKNLSVHKDELVNVIIYTPQLYQLLCELRKREAGNED
jgi:hypothetical protein